jgi:protein involved in polysaccharide export with SLBB domain
MINRFRKSRVFLVAILFVSILETQTAAQAVAQEPDSAATGTTQARTAATPDDVTQLQQLIQSRPDVLEELRDFLIQRLHQEGSAIDDQSVTDQMLYARLQSDLQFRNDAVQWLVDQGTISPETARGLMTAGGAAGVPSSARLPEGTSATEPEAAHEGTLNQPGAAPEGTLNQPGAAPEGALNQPGETMLGPSKPTALTREQRFDDSALNPRTVPQKNPYPGLPSTRVLYTQFPDQPKTLRRFGSDIFRPNVVGMNTFPMDIPAGSDYILGTGDTVTIDIWGGVSQRLTRVVDREGRVSLPDAGPVLVAGSTVAQAQKLIQGKLEPQYHDAKVDLSVTRVRTVRVYVVGDVQRPGAYDISSLSTPLNALYAAGGPTATGSLRIVKHYRGTQLVSEMDLYDLLIGGVRRAIEHLQPGDTILVPPVGPLVAVAGMVRRPAIYELLGDTQLPDVLQMAGGVSVAASLGEIKVERIEAHTNRILLNAKLSRVLGDKPLKDSTGSFWVKDGDRITVAPILPYSDKTVYLQGHIYRPGSYPYQDGMKITDLLHSYQDILPEPTNHGEIVRLQPPDFHPVTIEFDLAGALAGDETVSLQQFDTVRIFGRYQVDAPRVAVYGDVLRPGAYPMSSGMTAAGLVKMAGGFKRSAYRDSAVLASYVVENGQKVITNQQNVRIAAAIAGDTQADVRLKPGDILTILQITGWSDIGRSVNIAGEVAYPGNFGINEGEKLSSLLKRVGGFTSVAYPAGIVLDRVEVRQLEEKGRQELIRRLETMTATVRVSSDTTGQDQAALLQAMQQQQTQTLAGLKSQPVTGRLVLTITSDISKWENTPADISLRAGDVITVPKKPSFIVSFGQVYNPNAITYKPGKTAEWYLKQSGGPTELAYKKGIYIIRANGSVVSSSGTDKLFSGGVLNTKMEPGDVLVVPEKFVSGSSAWKTTLEVAQLLTSMALAAAVVVKL